MATYYASHDAAGGGSGTIGSPYTLQEILTNTSTGDLGLLMNTGTYAPSARITPGTNTATRASPKTIRGANADGTDDGTVVTISGVNLPASTSLFFMNLTNLCIVVENIHFIYSKKHNYETTTSISTVLKNVKCSYATQNGLQISGAQEVVLLNCEFNNNTSSGFFQINASAFYSFIVERCKFHHNNNGYLMANYVTTGTFPKFIDCTFYSNTIYGISTDAVASPIFDRVVVRNSVVFDNGSHGINLLSTVYGVFIENCIFRSNGGYGIMTNGANVNTYLMSNNCSNNNTSGHIDINSGVLPGTGNVTSDPLFTSETDGSEDFTLQDGSPCINTGIGY